MIQNRQNGFCRARGKTLTAARKRRKQRSRRHRVNVLGGIKRRGDSVLVKAGRQRAKHQAAMNSRIGINVLDRRQQLVLRNVGRKQNAASFDAHLFAALKGAALIGQIVLALAHTNDSKRRNNAALA